MNRLDSTKKLLEAAKLLLKSNLSPNMSCNNSSNISMVIRALEIAILRHSNPTDVTEMLEKVEILGCPSIEIKKQTEIDTSQAILAKRIRAGDFDDDLSGKIFEILSKDVLSRLERSNPDFISDKIFSQFSAT